MILVTAKWFQFQLRGICLTSYPWLVFTIWLMWLLLASPLAAGGEARPADKATREAGAGGHQPGPARRQRVAQSPTHERDHCELTLSICLPVRCLVYLNDQLSRVISCQNDLIWLGLYHSTRVPTFKRRIFPLMFIPFCTHSWCYRGHNSRLRIHWES